jgi:hypothetical protein
MGEKCEEEKPGVDLFEVLDRVLIDGKIQDDDQDNEGEGDGNIQPFFLRLLHGTLPGRRGLPVLS